MTALSTGIARQIDHITKNLGTEISATHREVARRLGQKERQNAARIKEEKAQDREQKEISGKRLPLARKGLAAILALAQHPKIQEMLYTENALLRAQGHPPSASFDFYSATRPSGDAWAGLEGRGSRDVDIKFFRKGVSFAYGAAHVEMQAVEIFYERGESEVERLFVWKELGSSAANPTDARLALDEEQRTLEWDPFDVAFQVLVDCASGKNLAFYLRRALRRKKEEFND
ncbi:hypothetical protein KW797_01595 [Candidatus Parcubacteria bacterium]|nr:hypothetical protein [Candidatus Parcubacteria bacterium]